jgi:hypothetical protein
MSNFSLEQAMAGSTYAEALGELRGTTYHTDEQLRGVI